MARSPALDVIKRKLRLSVFSHPRLYNFIAATKRNPFRVTSDTKLLIDGFPRSANSFVEAAIRATQPNIGRLAHHTHAPASVIEAARRNIPAVVLIREPLGAVSSFMEMYNGEFDAKLLLQEYRAFYECIEQYRPHYVLIDFTGVPLGLQRLPGLARTRFGLTLDPISMDDDLQRRVYSLVDRLGEERNGISVDRYSPFRPEADLVNRQERLELIRRSLAAPTLAADRNLAQSIYLRLRGTADIT